jgi:hypothetical protein
MIQIAIWGIALMLLVKGLDVVHQQNIAEASGFKPSRLLPLPRLFSRLSALPF